MSTLHRRADTKRRDRGFRPSALGLGGVLLEPKLSTSALFTRTGGTNFAWAADDGSGLSGPPTDIDANVPGAQGSQQWILASPDDGQLTATASSGAVISTATGPSGGSSIAVNGQVSGGLSGQVNVGIIAGGGTGAGVESYNAAGGTQAPLTWAVGDTNPAATSGNIHVTFQYSGTDGINPSTTVAMMGQFQLQILTPNLEILLNSNGSFGNGGAGFHVYENATPSNPFGWHLVASHSNSDGSTDGVVDYTPPANGNPGHSAQGSFSFGGAFSDDFTIPTNGGAGYFVNYRAAFNEIVNPGIPAGGLVLASPQMQWTFNVTATP